MVKNTLAVLAVTLALQAQSRIDSSFQKFWAADSPVSAGRAVEDVLKSGVTFDDALHRLKQGRTYAAQHDAQKEGVVQLSNHTSDGVEHFYAVTIPPGYDPARRYQVRFQLHGGVGGRADNKPRGNGQIGALSGGAGGDGVEQIYVIPYAWNDEPWWSDDQVLNLRTIVDDLKRRYNVDENRVVVAGVSDGGTGAYYVAMRDTTPYASFLPLNGYIMVLANGEIDDGHNFPNNIRNKPLFVVNGGRDRLYPISIVEPYTRHLMNNGVQIDYHPQPDGEHNTAWWPEINGPFEKFVAEHPRDPYPDKLTWEAADTVNNRAHWLVIDAYGVTSAEAKQLQDANIFTDSLGTDPLFTWRAPPGRVDLVRSGNTVQATTMGVTAFTLLLSPDKFDFKQPVIVTANGREVFRARVQPSMDTLMKWAARDNDRTMVYGAEIKIKLSR
jgi:pimeloyl-ACP methyl ester carboxylesterase